MIETSRLGISHFVSGFGIYTAVDIPARGIMVASTMFAVPFLNTKPWMGSDYSWSSSMFNIGYEGYPDYDIIMLSGLAGGFANAHTGITNLISEKARNEPILDRRTDPGAGAFSDILGFHFTSQHRIAAGEELFISYGEQWYVLC